MLPRLLLALCAVALALAVPATAAAAACPKTSLADLEDEVMCTVCGTTLGLATEAPQAQRERAFIQSQVERCRSKEEIKASVVAEFGPEGLADPEAEGFSLAAYLVPVLVILGGGGAVALAALRWRRGRAVGRSGPGPPAGDASRLEEDLGRYDL
ncbi:MAG: cytochrome c-type biogenesis protein CcmH [Thermoleophilaceae bacterium]